MKFSYHCSLLFCCHHECSFVIHRLSSLCTQCSCHRHALQSKGKGERQRERESVGVKKRNTKRVKGRKHPHDHRWALPMLLTEGGSYNSEREAAADALFAPSCGLASCALTCQSVGPRCEVRKGTRPSRTKDEDVTN